MVLPAFLKRKRRGANGGVPADSFSPPVSKMINNGVGIEIDGCSYIYGCSFYEIYRTVIE